jgi:diamine N-acetyltransferase
MPDKYQTTRLHIRPTNADDLDRVLELEGDPDNSQYIRHWDRDKHLTAMADPNIGHFVIELKDTHTIIGHIILVGLTNPDNNIEFKRITIAEKGQGYGREAVRWIRRYAFEEIKAHRLWLEVMETNKRAYGLYRAEGFVDEGLHRESLRQGDKYISLIVMSILTDEYRRLFC